MKRKNYDKIYELFQDGKFSETMTELKMHQTVRTYEVNKSGDLVMWDSHPLGYVVVLRKVR